MQIMPMMTHTCITRSGPMAGNDYVIDIHPYMVEYGSDNICPNCHDRIIDKDKIIARIYEFLTTGK